MVLEWGRIQSVRIQPPIFNKSSISRITKSILLFAVFLIFFVGCSSTNISQDGNITTIETVLENQFTGPDQEFIELLNSPENVTIIGDDSEASDEDLETFSELDLYLEEKYKSFFTPNMYNKFIATYALGYQVAAFNGGFEIETDNIYIEKSDTIKGSYDFIANILYHKEGNEQMTAEVSGKAEINEESKITSIRFLDDNGLMDVLKAER